MPRYPSPHGYRGYLNQIPSDPMQAPPMGSVERSERQGVYAQQLKNQFDGVLIRAIQMWGVAYVKQQVALAVAHAQATGQ